MSWRILVLIFLSVFLNGDLCDDAPSHHDDHVCPTTVKELRSYKVTFICKNKKICRRTKQKSVSVLKNICCLGWKSCNGECIKESDVCASPECVNGIYKDKNCTCDFGLVHLNETHCGPKCSDGFYNDLFTTNFTCKSKCSEPCVNGICTDFDTCTCLPGLVNFNETHCGPDCPKGFHNDLTISNLSCVSDCSQPCVNAICTDIETCTCDSGLVHLNKTHCGPKCSDGFYNNLTATNLTCVSKCSEPCVNGICTDFDTCTCLRGLVFLNKTHCGPECTRGSHNDLSVSSLACVSDCSQPCVNGICTDIETCKCDLGLVKLNKTHCGPKCSDGFYNDLTTTNFTCVSKCSEPCVNGICTDFDTCTCLPGLVYLNKTHCGPDCPKGFHNDLTISDLSCVTDCSQPCVNAICTDIETCTCDSSLVNLNKTHCGPKCSDGFYNNLTTTNFTCVSKCSEPCVNGLCSDFDTCTCLPGLVYLNKTHCGPDCPKGFHNDLTISDLSCVSDCSQPCVNAICTDIKTCTCDTGLVNFNNTHCGPKCSDGFYNDLTTTNFTCVSKCSEPCVNGICTDFDTCTCLPGLVYLNKTHCGPDCPKGFHNDLTISDLSCVSDCSQPCVNAICTDIETCTCDSGLVNLNKTHCGPKCADGFYNDLTTTNFTCVSKCSKPCVNGICTDFDTCTCLRGLVFLNKTHCGPECTRGSHNDLSVSSLACVSDCSQPCVNGICTDIETCTCDSGLVNLNKTHCGPKCSDGFYNNLTATNLTCVSKCSEPCVNGICTDFDTCTCLPGLVYLNKTHCGPDCPKGFHNDLTISDLSCVTDCSQPCVNAICTDIETCTCDSSLVNLNKTHCGPKCSDGFYNNLTTTNFTCVSKCSEPCVNGLCSDFDTCTCLPGLVYLNKTHCGPDCPKGFHNDLTISNLSCVSDCSQPCVNAICTDIKTCTCDTGLVNLNNTHCGPKCSDGFYNDLTTTNFTCVSKCSEPCVNGICTDFDTCTCLPGLVYLNKTHCGPDCPKGFHNDLTISDLSCVSDCSQPCVNAICTDIETCTCDSGLVNLNKTHCGPKCADGFYNDLTTTNFTCVSKCSKPCVNGICTDFDTCTCLRGLVFLNKTHCGPECTRGSHNDLSVSSLACVSDCSQPCVNGICTDIETCTCDSGLVNLNKTHCGPKCSDGFYNDLSTANFTCVSKCSKPCVNGICTDFDICTCLPGLVYLNKTHCGPDCPKGFHNDLTISDLSCVSDCSQPCVNAICTDIETCTCDLGLVNLNKTHCRPKCSDGFYNDLTTTNFTCVSKCNKPCVNGICTNFDICTCLPGLVNVNKTHCGPDCPKGFHNDLTISDLSCVSDCSQPCVNAICTDIETCTCDSGLVNLNKTHCGPKCSDGFYNNLTTTNFTCVSKCSEPCVNGICSDFDTCTCLPGLVYLNKTHCGPNCPKGFHNDLTISDLSCVSDCSQPCVNAICTDIKTCTCDTGLVNLNNTHCGPKCSDGFYNDLTTTNFTCVSKCSEPCVNGICTDFDTCTCLPGLVNVNKTHCGPDCPKGFHNDLTISDLSCVSDCSQPCVNAICTDIETCTCDSGLVNLNKTHCGPKCSDGFYNNLTTTNFTCVSKCSEPCVNGICSDFDTCTCLPGLVYLNKTHCGPNCPKGFHNDLTISDLSCVSDCSQPCVNAICTDIETCTCDSGLVNLNKTHCGPKCSDGFYNDLTTTNFTCVSKCSEPCVNGICTDFDTCTCLPGLVYLNKTHCGLDCPKGFHNDLAISDLSCVSDCSQPCVNGICTDIENCTCDSGMVKLNMTHCAPECPRGFHNDMSVASLPCESDCSETCVNAICTGIDICSCNPGLINYNKTHCGPKCPMGSHNDISVASLICVSDCKQPCVNGFCKSTDTCSCYPGFVPLNGTHCIPQCPIGFHNDRSKSDFSCTSKCSRPCSNGTCIDFDKCMCNTGYIPNEASRFECEPKCTNCTNGVCGAPNKCSCNKGYAKNYDDICEPQCIKPCKNGYCSTPNRCECNAGYFYNETVKKCVVACKNVCINSTCVSPDICECWSGYVRSNVSGICKPYCSFCSNGECIGPNICQCTDGYKLHNNNCEQYHNEALSASYSWVPVCVVGIILAIALVLFFSRGHLMKTWRQTNGDMLDIGVSSNELNMGQPYECKYKNNGGDDLEIRLNNTHLARVSSLDYIEKL